MANECPVDGNIQTGNTIRNACVFSNAANNLTPIDPTNVFVEITRPDGTATTYEYNTDPELVRTSVGNYYIDQPLDDSGSWYFRWYSTGNVLSSSTQTIRVLP